MPTIVSWHAKIISISKVRIHAIYLGLFPYILILLVNENKNSIIREVYYEFFR